MVSAKQVFLHEVPFDLEVERSPIEVDYYCCSDYAFAMSADVRRERADNGVVREYGVVLVRDRAVVPIANASVKRRVFAVASKDNSGITEIPEAAGLLIGSFQAGRYAQVWYVFGEKVEQLRQAKQRENASEPAPSARPSQLGPGTAAGPMAKTPAPAAEPPPALGDLW